MTEEEGDEGYLSKNLKGVRSINNLYGSTCIKVTVNIYYLVARVFNKEYLCPEFYAYY